MATKKEPTEAETAVIRLANANKELSRLKQNITVTKREIEDKQQEISSLQEKAQEAADHLESLQKKDSTLQDRHHSQGNRLLIAQGTSDEQKEREHLETIFTELERNKAECAEASKIRDETRTALLQVPQLQKEITALQDELRQHEVLHDKMHELWEETHELVGRHKYLALKDKIEEKEIAVKAAEKVLAEAKQELQEEQKSIGVVLVAWEDKAKYLKETHGYVSPPETPTHRVLDAFLHYVETLRDHSAKCKAAVSVNGVAVRLAQLITITSQDLNYYGSLTNWHNIPFTNKRGETEYILSNQRYDVVRDLLQKEEVTKTSWLDMVRELNQNQ